MLGFSKLLSGLLLVVECTVCSAFMPAVPAVPAMPVARLSGLKSLKMTDGIDRRSMFSMLQKAVVSYSLLSSLQRRDADAYNMDEIGQIALYEKALPSVCYISTEYKNIASSFNMSSGNLPKGVGTGFIWDKQGHIITNFHVINKVDSAIVSFGNKDYVAKLTGADPDRDIAVLKIDREAGQPVVLASNAEIRIGQYAFAIGNPFGQEYTFTMGIISGKHRKITSPSGRKITEVIQTDAAINPGNSGGPLLNSDGKLIGMNTATYGVGVSSGVNFAVSVDTLKESVGEIIEFGMVQRAVLGITYLDASNKSSTGILVLDVPDTSPAYKAGLLKSDIIIAMDDNKIDKPDDLSAALGKYKPADKVKLKILRGADKTPMTLDVVLGAFKVKTYSGLEYENRKVNASVPMIPLDIPLKDMAPKLRP